MEMNDIQNVFEYAGYPILFEKFQYKLYVSGLFEQIEDPTIIEDFLDFYQFDAHAPLYFFEFSYFFQTFLYSRRFTKSLGATE